MQGSAQFLAKSILVAAILCGVSGAVHAGTDLNDFCLSLGHKLALNKEASESADVAFREAQQHMKSFLNLGSLSRLAKAWAVVVKDEPCGKHSADYVTTIAECNPTPTGGLVALYEAVKRYSDKCLTAAFWDKQLHKTIGSSGDKSSLAKFVDARFLEQYRNDNPDEQELHFATIFGGNCCQASSSHKALLQALEPILGANTRAIAQSDRKRLESALQERLFKPCEKYVKRMKHLMWQASRAANYHAPDEQSFVDGLSQEFKDALFRYKYCSNFRYLFNAQEKLDKINMNGF